jgi:hypothetical protein
MNNQELENQPKAKVDVTKRRRFLQKAGIVAPVILTFSSRSVFGEQLPCGSGTLSGDISHHAPLCDRGSFNTSSFISTKSLGAKSDKSSQFELLNFPSINGYDQNTVFNDVFPGSKNYSTFAQTIATNATSRDSIYIVAFMNAQISNSYVLRPAQLTALYSYPANRPTGYASDTDFLLSTFAQ